MMIGSSQFSLSIALALFFIFPLTQSVYLLRNVRKNRAGKKNDSDVKERREFFCAVTKYIPELPNLFSDAAKFEKDEKLEKVGEDLEWFFQVGPGSQIHHVMGNVKSYSKDALTSIQRRNSSAFAPQYFESVKTEIVHGHKVLTPIVQTYKTKVLDPIKDLIHNQLVTNIHSSVEDVFNPKLPGNRIKKMRLLLKIQDRARMIGKTLEDAKKFVQELFDFLKGNHDLYSVAGAKISFADVRRFSESYDAIYLAVRSVIYESVGHLRENMNKKMPKNQEKRIGDAVKTAKKTFGCK